MTLSQAIKAAKLDWVNPHIEKNFSYDKPRNADYKLFHFDREIESEEAVEEMEKEGYSPATLTELLAYATDGWNGKDWVTALGSVVGVGGYRDVPYLDGLGAGRMLGLDWWSLRCSRRFLAVRADTAIDKIQQTVVECTHEINYCPSCGAKVR